MTLMQMKYAIAVADTKSMNEAARSLFITQPSLSASVKELENEIGVELFKRTNRGITVTPEGEEFLGYARQVVEQYRLIESKYIEKENVRKKFSVSMQHYSFAVQAFVEMVRQFDEFDNKGNNYNIRMVKSYMYDDGIAEAFRGTVYDSWTKLFTEFGLEFHRLLDCGIYAYMWKGNPLASRESVTMDDLQPYPCLAFEQGNNNSFYFAEEVLSTYEYKQLIRANDRATMLNLMKGLNGYTLCSGIICEELNGSDYRAVPFRSLDQTGDIQDENQMEIGYVTRKNLILSKLGQEYVMALRQYLA